MTQQPELDDILDSVLVGMYCTNPDGDFVPLDDSKNILRAEAKQAILDWHNKQILEMLKDEQHDDERSVSAFKYVWRNKLRRTN